MIRKIGIVLNAKKKKALPLSKTIRRFIKRKGLVVLDEIEVGREEAVRGSELVITLGGDGTLLNIIKYINKKEMPIMGVNVGGFGFITEVSPDEVLEVLDKTLRGKSTFSFRSLLEISLYPAIKELSEFAGGVCRKRKKIKIFKALNDAVITKGAVSRIMTLRIDIDGEFVTSYFCDGLIVATPTGSTAHSLSAGGPIIYPSTPCLVLSPICPHTLSNRPLVVSENSQVSISPIGRETKEMVLTVDGQDSVSLQEKDILKIKVSPTKIKLISSGKRKYFEILREKLKWGGTR
jgi:NAD+ kinase